MSENQTKSHDVGEVSYNLKSDKMVLKMREHVDIDAKYRYLNRVEVYANDKKIFDGVSNPVLIVKAFAEHMGYDFDFAYNHEI